MSGGCAKDPEDLTKGQDKPIANTATASNPSFNLSSMAMYPTVLGWGILYTIVALSLMFLGSYIGGITSIIEWWSTFIWSSLVVLLVVLAMINGAYNAMLVKMSMCADALNSFLKVSMTILSLITILLCYIMMYDFGTNQNTTTYLLAMLHVNFFISIVNLCLVTIHKLSDLSIK